MTSLTHSLEMPWSIDQSLNIDRVSMEELKLIFNQAEKRLDDASLFVSGFGAGAPGEFYI